MARVEHEWVHLASSGGKNSAASIQKNYEVEFF